MLTLLDATYDRLALVESFFLVMRVTAVAGCEGDNNFVEDPIMNATSWVKSNVDYGRRLVESGLAGADCGRKEFLQEEPLRPFLGESARKALKFSTAAACLGVGTAFLTKAHRKRTLHTFAFAIAGAALGFAAGVTWESRRFLASMTRQAIKDVNATRDEHWLQTNPIDYA